MTSSVCLPVRFHLQLNGGSASATTSSSSKAASAAAAAAAKITPEGSTHAMTCSPSMTFAEIKQKIWTKKGLPPGDAAQYTFKLASGEMVLDDEDTFARFLEMNECFREDEKSSTAGRAAAGTPATTGKDAQMHMLECILLHRDHLEVKHVREKRATTLYGTVLHKGAMSLRSSGLVGNNWKHRYFIIHDMTLVGFESEKAYLEGKPIEDSWPLGAVVAVRCEITDRSHAYSFELQKPVAPGATLPAGGVTPAGQSGKHAVASPTFYCDTEPSLLAWMSLVNRLHLRRIKLIVVNCAEELESRGLESAEGLFRLSGNKTHVEQLQAEYDAGKLPNLAMIEDEGILASFVKNNLRNMPEPLLTFDLYPAFVGVIVGNPLSHTDEPAHERRCEALRAVVERLPQAHQGLLEYLMSFLCRVSEHSSTNKMTAANLAIVFSPNLLRPKVENVATVMSDGKHVQDIVQFMISEARQLWPNFTNTRRPSRLAFFNVQAVKEKGLSQPPALPTVPEAAATAAAAVTSPTSAPPQPPPQPQQQQPQAAFSYTMGSSSKGPHAPPPKPPGASPPPLPSPVARTSGPPALPPSASPTAAAAAAAAAAVVPPPPSSASLAPTASTPSPSSASSRPGFSKRLSVAAVVSQVNEAPPTEDLTAVMEHAAVLAAQWSHAATSTATLQAGLQGLLAAHQSAITSGQLTREQSSDAAATVQRCLGILSADMLRFELDLANLNRYIADQTKASPTAAAPSPAAAVVSPKPPAGRAPPPLPSVGSASMTSPLSPTPSASPRESTSE